jgi:hypothetical protein
MKNFVIYIWIGLFLATGLFLIAAPSLFDLKDGLFDKILSSVGVGFIATCIISFFLEITWSKHRADYEKEKFQDIVKEWKLFATRLSELENHLSAFKELGLDSCKKNREDSLEKFYDFADKLINNSQNNQNCVKHVGTINIVSSSARGLLGYLDREPSNIQELWCNLVKDKSIFFKFLLTHPAYAHLRQPAEERESGDIEVEIIKTTVYLHCVCNMKEDNLRLFRGSPTVFQIQVGNHFLLNPYPYGKMAMETLSLEFSIDNIDSKKKINYVEEFAKKHFNHTWAFFQQPSKKVDGKPMVIGIKDFNDILVAFSECTFLDPNKFRLNKSQIEELDYFTTVVLVDRFGDEITSNIPRDSNKPFENYLFKTNPNIILNEG